MIPSKGAVPGCGKGVFVTSCSLISATEQSNQQIATCFPRPRWLPHKLMCRPPPVEIILGREKMNQAPRPFPAGPHDFKSTKCSGCSADTVVCRRLCEHSCSSCGTKNRLRGPRIKLPAAESPTHSSQDETPLGLPAPIPRYHVQLPAAEAQIPRVQPQRHEDAGPEH